MKLSLTDAQITVNGFVSSCKCKCKHCLLCSSDNLIPCIPFDKLAQLAMKFIGFYRCTGIDVGLGVYNCSDYPQLPQAMEIDRKISCFSGYQNLNGTPVREGKELADWVSYLKYDCKLQNANISWFGTRELHDTFVSAKGYYDYLLELSKELKRQDVSFTNSIFILRSNINELANLHHTLMHLGGRMHYSLLDYRGNAKKIFHEFLDVDSVNKLPQFLYNNSIFNFKRYKMNSEWVDATMKHQAPEQTKRIMFLVATPDNIDQYLYMSINDIFTNTELQSFEYLASNYGRNSGEVLIDYRSALWRWMELFFEEEGIDKTLLFSDLHNSVMWR